MNENFEQTLEAMKADPCKITPEAMEGLWRPARVASTAFSEAMAAYNNDLNTRRDVLKKQALDLDIKIKSFESQIATLEEGSRNAVSRGDLDTAANQDEQAEQLRKQLSTAKRKRCIITGVELKGDPELFKAVQIAKKNYEAAEKSSRECVNEAIAVVNEWKEFFENLQRKTRIIKNLCPYIDLEKYDKIDHHFNAEYYTRISAKLEAEREEREAAEELIRRTKMGTFLAI